MMTAPAAIQPIVLLSDSRRAKLQQQLTERIGAWARLWSTAPQQPIVEFIEESSERTLRNVSPANACYRVTNGTAVLLRLRVSPGFLPSAIGLAAKDAIAYPEAYGGLAAELFQQMLRSLADEVLRHLAVPGRSFEPDPSPKEPSDTGRYGVTVEAGFGRAGASIIMQLPSATLSPLIRGTPSPAPAEPMHGRLKAVENSEVQLEAVLGYATVSVVELTSLGAGDIIVLDEELTHPGYLQTKAGTQVGQVSFGRVASARAVRITSPVRHGLSQK